MVKIEKDGIVQEVKERYLNRFLDTGWAVVSDTTPKKLSKNKIIKVDAEVEPAVETEPVQEEVPPTNPPINIQGE
jgi:hypothetical protein